MKIYLSLVSVFLRENFSLKRLFGFDFKKEKIKAILIGIAILYAVGIVFGMIGYLFYDLGEFLSDFNMLDLMLVFLASYAILIGILFSLLRSNGYIFHYKDYPLLGSLPIDSKVLLLAKLSLMFIMIYVMIFLMSLPVMFAYFYWAGFHIIKLLFVIVGLIFLPIFPVLIGSFISLLIARLASKFRYAQLLTIVLMLGLFAAFMIGSFTMSTSQLENPLIQQQSFMDLIAQYYLPLRWFQVGVHELNVLTIFGVVVLNALPIVLFVVLAYGFVNRTNQTGLGTAIRKNRKEAISQSKSVMSTLVHKEMKKFFSVPVYVLNAGIGPLFLLVIPIVGLFYRDTIQSIMVELGGSETSVEVGVLVFIAFSLSMVYTASISLSLEGKNFWVVKSLPIKAYQVVFSKVVFNLWLGLPVALFGVIALGFTFNLVIIDIIVIMIAAIGFAFFKTVLDAVINLHMPKLDFVNDVEVIKQSASAFLGVFAGFAIIITNGLVFYFFDRYIGFVFNLVVITMMNAMLGTLLCVYIYRKSEKLFYRMKA